MKVLDASVLYHLSLNTPRAAAVAAHLDDDLFAPDLLLVEVLNRLRQMWHGQVISPELADDAVEVLCAADIEYVPVWPYTARIWELRANVATPDACYVALAEDLGCPLLTTDARLARAPGIRIPVVVA